MTTWTGLTRSICGYRIAVLTIMFFLNSASASTCGDEFLSGFHNPYRFCSSVVDYAYYIPDGETADSLNTAVRAKAERYYIEFFPLACKESLKRALCAETYLPCEDGVVTKKPCAMLCEATTGSDGVCNGLMERFNYQANCSDTSIFDPSDDPSVCNTLPNVDGVQLVADRNEPYVGSVCENYVEHYFVPEASAYYAPLAPMPLPNLFQGYQEASAATWINYMPKYESADCLTAFRKVVCATMFNKPQPISSLDDVFGTVYLQQFPSRDLCTNYAEQCSWILDVAPSLGIDCTTSYPGWDGNPLYLYGESSQYVKGLVYNGAWTLLATEPNRVNTEIAENTIIEQQCPLGLVIPEDPSLARITQIVPGCAASCPSFVFTEDEYDSLGSNYLIVCVVSLVACLWFLANTFFISKKKANIFILICVAMFTVFMVVKIVLLSVFPADGSGVCSSNASMYDKDQYTDGAWTACVFHATFSTANTLVSLYCVLCASSELFLKVNLGMKDVHMKTHKRVMFIGYAALITAWGLGYLVGTDVNLDKTITLCEWKNSDVMAQFWSFDFILILLVCFIAVLNSALAYSMIKMSTVTGSSFYKTWNTYKYLFCLMLLFLVIWIMVIGVYYIDVYLFQYDSYVDGVAEYYDCLFENFVSKDDTSYIDICGERPAVRYPLYLDYLLMSVTLCTGLAYPSISFMSGTVSKFYLGLIDMCFQSSIASRLIPKTIYESRYESKVEPKMESSVELSNRRKSVSIVTPSQLKKSKVIPVLPLNDEQETHRSDDSGGDGSPKHVPVVEEGIREERVEGEITTRSNIDKV